VYKKVVLLIPVIFIVVCWGLGYVLGRKQTTIGPYYFRKTEGAIYFKLPALTEEGDRTHSYSKAKMYRLIENPNTGNLLTKNTEKARDIMEGQTRLEYIGYIPLERLKEIIGATNYPKNEDYIYGLMMYEYAGKFANALKKVDFGLVTIIGWFLLVIMFFSKSGVLLLYWWWWVLAMLIGKFGLLGFWRTTEQNSHVILLEFIRYLQTTFFSTTRHWYTFLFLFGLVVPAIGITMLLVFVTKHLMPRRKREMEDFFKIDKDEKKRKELSIESVNFKRVKFKMPKKLARYRNTDRYFLGVDDKKRDIVLGEENMNRHVHALGPTGSGKTSLMVLPLAWQVLEKGRGVCFIDFKGDDVLKKIVYKKAKEAGKKFYYFSIDPLEETLAYNPLFSGDIHSKVDRIMSAMELIYKGPASFYSNVQAMTFIYLLKEMQEDERKIDFGSIKEVLEDEDFLARIKVEFKDIRGLLAALTRIADVEILNRNEINLEKIIEDQDVAFFALKSQVNTQLAEAIGRMVIIDLKFQAVKRSEIDAFFYIFIDEFQNLASNHFVDLISKVRSANFCLILSNQSRGNLLTISKAFENTVFTNTASKIIFNQEDPEDARFWADKTGKTTYQSKGMRQFAGTSWGGEKTILDGRRETEGTIHTSSKNLISENVFLKLPFGKSVVFKRNELAVLANHEFLFDRNKRDELLSLPFEYEPPGGMEDNRAKCKTDEKEVKRRKEEENDSKKLWRQKEFFK